MKSITFVSTFPTEANMRDGYFRRVHYVDQAFVDHPKVHLDIRFATNFVKKTIQRDSSTQILHLNAFIHFFLIGKVLRNSGIVYIHSIAKVPSIFLQLLSLKNKVPFALDLHGVMVDELKLEGNGTKANLYSKIEAICFKHCKLTIYVSKVMQKHYQEKYPDYQGKEVIYATNSNTISNYQSPISDQKSSVHSAQSSVREEVLRGLGFSAEDVILLYSGNTQPWQLVDLMLQIMNQLSEQPNIKFLILSGQKRQFEGLVAKHHIPKERVQILSVSPDDLGLYYDLAHYGFILRDDILVNRVANPTKLAEYLEYGIIPIVKLSAIGDYEDFGYDFINSKDLLPDQLILAPRKSEKNKQVFAQMGAEYGSENLRKRVSEAIGDTN